MRDSLGRDIVTQTVGRPTFVLRFPRLEVEDSIFCSVHLREYESQRERNVQMGIANPSYEIVGRTGAVCRTCVERPYEE